MRCRLSSSLAAWRCMSLDCFNIFISASLMRRCRFLILMSCSCHNIIKPSLCDTQHKYVTLHKLSVSAPGCVHIIFAHFQNICMWETHYFECTYMDECTWTNMMSLHTNTSVLEKCKHRCTWWTHTYGWCAHLIMHMHGWNANIIITSLNEVSFAKKSSFSWSSLSDFAFWCCKLQDPAHDTLGNNTHHKMHYSN